MAVSRLAARCGLIINAMYLRAGLFSLALLLVSRLLGLARESALAAAFGASGMGDAVIVMFTLPDLLVGVLVSGALAYVLLPGWAAQAGKPHGGQSSRLTLLLALAGLAVGGLVWAFRQAVVAALAPGLSSNLAGLAAASLAYSAAVLPLAMVAALWATRLQHERDFVGMYAANLVVNLILVTGLLAVGGGLWAFRVNSLNVIHALGGCLVLAMVCRLLWLGWRLRKASALPDAPPKLPPQAPQEALPKGELSLLSVSPSQLSSALPPARLWLWAALSSALVLLLPLVARSLVSQSGEGALASFNYAWKLIELPLLLAIQLVATIAFPAIAAAPADSPERQRALAIAFALAWTLACAAVAVVAVFSRPLADLLFGWGSMSPAAISVIAYWSAIGVWSLLPQALIAVLLTAMATTQRMRVAVFAYGAAVAALLAFGLAIPAQGEVVMWAVNLTLGAVALSLLVTERRTVRGALPFGALAGPLAVCVLLVLLKPLWLGSSLSLATIVAVVFGALVLAVGVLCSPVLRKFALQKSRRNGEAAST